MDGQSGVKCACDSGTNSQKSGVFVTPRMINKLPALEKEKVEGASQRTEETSLPNTGRSNVSGSEQIGSEPIRVSEQMRSSLPNIQKTQKREDDHSSSSQPFAFNRTPNIDGDSTKNNAYVSQIVFDNFDANHGAEGSGTPRQGGSGWITPVAPASRKVSHSRTSTGIATPISSRNTTPRVRTLKQPRYRTGDPIICVYCMDSQGMGSSCPKCGKHNNEKARRYVPGERPDVCLPINDEIAVGSVPGSARVGSESGRFKPGSPIQAEETPREFQYTGGHDASGSQQAALARAQVATQLRGRFGNHSHNSLNLGTTVALLTSNQNTESEIQHSTDKDMEGSNLTESISMQQPNSSREVTPRTECSGNGMRLWESSSGSEGPVKSGSRYSGSAHVSSRTKVSASATAMRLLFAGGSSILSSKLRRRRTVLEKGTASQDAGAPGKQQGMQPVAPSMPSGRHGTGENFANAYADTNVGGYLSVNSDAYRGNANGGYPNATYPNGSHGGNQSGYSGSHGNQRKDARTNDPVHLIVHRDSSSIGDEGADGENIKKKPDRGSQNAQAILCDGRLEERMIGTSQNMDTQKMDRQNAGLTGFSYEQVASNPALYHSLRNQIDAQAGSVQSMQSGMQGTEVYPGMSESGISSQTGTQNVGSQTGVQNVSGRCKPEKGSVMSGKISAVELFSTLKGSLRRDKKSVENVNPMNTNPVSRQEDSFKRQQFPDQTESTFASLSAARSPVGSPLQSFLAKQVQSGPSVMSSSAWSKSPSVVTPAVSRCTSVMHTPRTHTSNTPQTSVHVPTANNMYNEQQQAPGQSVADRVAQQQSKMKAKRELEVAQVMAANMAVIRASQKSASVPQNSREQKSNGGISSRQKRIGTFLRQEMVGTSPRQGEDGEFGNRDEMIVAPGGQQRKSSKGSKSKEEEKKRSSQQKEQEQDAFKEQVREVGFQWSKQDGNNKQATTCSRSPRELSIEAVSDQHALSAETTDDFKKVSTDSADSGFAQGNPEDGGCTNVPAGANENDVALVNGNNINFGDGMDNGLNDMSITAPIKRNRVPSQKGNSNKDVNHTVANGSPYGNNTQSNKECEDCCNSLLSSVHLSKVDGLVNNSEATSKSKKAPSQVDAVDNVRNIVPVNNANVDIAQLDRVLSTWSSIEGDSLVEVNRALDELEKAKEQELRVYSRVNSIFDELDFVSRQFAMNDPLGYMIDHSDIVSGDDGADADTNGDGEASHYSGLESGGPGTNHPNQPGEASGTSLSARGPQSPHSGSHDPKHGRSGRNAENRMEMGYWSDGSGDGMG